MAATAPAYCLTGEGRPVIITTTPGAASTGDTSTASTVGREGVATIEVSYTISGGRGPYTVTNPDSVTTGGAAGDSSSASTGVLSVSCALAGVNLDDVDASINVVEAGPKTISLQVTDADGATDTAEFTIQIAEDDYTTEYNGGTMRAGRTYVLGDSDEWTLITLPTGLDLRFEGISMDESAGLGVRDDRGVQGRQAELCVEW